MKTALYFEMEYTDFYFAICRNANIPAGNIKTISSQLFLSDRNLVKNSPKRIMKIE